MTGDPHGVKALAMEMLLCAWRDAHGGFLDPNASARRQAQAGARHWLENPDSGALSLSECAEVLGLDVEAVQRYLLDGPPKRGAGEDNDDVVLVDEVG